MKLLLENQTTNTDGSQATQTLNNSLLFGKYLTVFAYGTWDGATATLEFSPDSGVTWITAGNDTTFTEDSGGNIYVTPGGISLRFSITGAGASTDITAGVN